jgi:hypothetical protein
MGVFLEEIFFNMDIHQINDGKYPETWKSKSDFMISRKI